MELPIQPTHILEGKDAERFDELMAIWEDSDYNPPEVHVSEETIRECVRRIKAAKQKGNTNV